MRISGKFFAHRANHLTQSRRGAEGHEEGLKAWNSTSLSIIDLIGNPRDPIFEKLDVEIDKQTHSLVG
jgi:hypothetical protein